MMKFNKIANKNVLLDVPTSTLLSSLKERRLAYGLSTTELAGKLCISRRSITSYERKEYPPTLLTLINIGEFFSYDLSPSLNYKFFHGLIHSDEIKARMKFLGLTCVEVARLTGYSAKTISSAININASTSIFCLNAVLSVLDRGTEGR